jgi:hypothetical protein
MQKHAHIRNVPEIEVSRALNVWNICKTRKVYLFWPKNCHEFILSIHITKHNTTQPRPHNTTQHNTAQHNTTQHNTTQHSTAQHNTTQHNTTQHNTTRHNTNVVTFTYIKLTGKII